MTLKLEKTVYTAHATSTGGRDGKSKTDDGKIDLTLAVPKEMGGNGNGTNPEQLFACGYSACFLGAMRFAASQRKEKTIVPDDATVGADVGIGPLADKLGFGITVTLNVKIPGWDQAKTKALVDEAHEICPYSNATRGNVDVKFNVS